MPASPAGHRCARIYQPPDLTDPDHRLTSDAPAPPALPPVMPLLAGDLSGLQSPGLLPHSREALSCLVLSLRAGGPGLLAPVASAPWCPSHSWARRYVLALKPNRVLVISPGDTLSVIAERYGHHRAGPCARRNPENWRPTKRLFTVVGDTLQPAGWSSRHTVDPCATSTRTASRDGPLVLEGRQHCVLADFTDTTNPTLREYNLTGSRAPGAEGSCRWAWWVNVPAIAQQ